ncbi:hypothetical protein PR048_008195 [Dryococelus australis]|uniref:Uncharacterized protein n=1 Tax=Dryococelus australis TaxID=614101 RepID=A0ABQ9HWF3_9NEOP|nr:hypothetical protein PR048_008195 [Dryococelus australis]
MCLYRFEPHGISAYKWKNFLQTPKQQINETTLYWWCMPQSNSLRTADQQHSRMKVCKDPLVMLGGSNVVRIQEAKLLVIGKSLISRALKEVIAIKYKMSKKKKP